VKEKRVITNMERYGVAYPMQNADIAEKQGKETYQWKEYKFPCGTTVKYQGYENLAYDELVKEGYVCNDLVTSRKKVPEIWYETHDGSRHRYYVDIYIPSKNKMIEVKSTWTYEKKRDKVHAKGHQCKSNGYEYEIWIYDSKSRKDIVCFY